LGISLGLLLLMAAACVSEPEKVAWGKGRALTINISGLALVPEVTYSVGDTHYVIRPKASGARLAVAKVYLRNDRSSQISMLVNEKAAFLTDRRSNRLGPLDPYTNRRETQEAPVDGARYLPLLWGTTEILKGYEIQGWMFFEVPEDFTAERFNWEQAESIWVTIKDVLESGT
jgi:hypothetical protein